MLGAPLTSANGAITFNSPQQGSISALIFFSIPGVTTDVHGSGGSKGGARDARPPLAQNFFIFMQFSAKIGQIIGWRPPPPFGVSAPSSEKSWIRHCMGFCPLLILFEFSAPSKKPLRVHCAVHR